MEFVWNRALAERFGDSPARRILSVRLVPYAVSASLACGFWLAALRHDTAGAAAMAQGFVAGIGQTASALLSGRASLGYTAENRIEPAVTAVTPSRDSNGAMRETYKFTDGLSLLGVGKDD